MVNKIFRGIELALFVVVVGLALGKLEFVRTLSPFLTMALSLQAIFYFGCSVPLLNKISTDKVVSDGNIQIDKMIAAGAFGLFASVVQTGICFKLMSWIGGNEMLVIGLSGLGLTGLAAIVAPLFKKSYTPILIRVFIFLSTGTTILLTPQNTIIDLYYRNYPVYRELLKKAVSAERYDKNLYDQLDKEAEKLP